MNNRIEIPEYLLDLSARASRATGERVDRDRDRGLIQETWDSLQVYARHTTVEQIDASIKDLYNSNNSKNKEEFTDYKHALLNFVQDLMAKNRDEFRSIYAAHNPGSFFGASRSRPEGHPEPSAPEEEQIEGLVLDKLPAAPGGPQNK